MKKRTQREAERAALVQRDLLSRLERQVGRAQRRTAELIKKTDGQFDGLLDIQDKLNEIRRHLTNMEADRQRWPAIDEAATQDLLQRIQPSGAELDRALQQWPDLSMGLTIPNAEGDWNAYMREVDRYIDDRGIDIGRDPLEQLLPAGRAAEICRRFDRDFGPTPWDRWDYGAVVLTVLVGTLLDYFLVATPGASFKGAPQRGSPVTAWMKEQSKKLAPMSGSDVLERNAFQNWVAELTTKAEAWAQVPFDVVSPKLDLTPNTHRIAAIGHDPLLGLVFGAKDIICGTCTFIDASGAWQVIPGTASAERGVLGTLATVIAHGFSDVFTAQGLPPPFLSALQALKVNPTFTLKEGGDPVSVPNLVRHMYSNGYDLRHFATMTIVPAVAELIIRSYHFVRTRGQTEELGKDGIRGRLKLSQMLALTHGLLASGNILKTALYGWNPTALNFAQFLALGKQWLSVLKLSAEQDAAVQEHLAEGWEALLAGSLGQSAKRPE